MQGHCPRGGRLRRSSEEGRAHWTAEGTGLWENGHKPFLRKPTNSFYKKISGTEARSPGRTGDTQGSHSKSGVDTVARVAGAGKPLGLEKMCRQGFQVQAC